MLNLLFYLGCILVMLKGIELLADSLRELKGTSRTLKLAGGIVGVVGALLMVWAGEHVAGLERENARMIEGNA